MVLLKHAKVGGEVNARGKFATRKPVQQRPQAELSSLL